MRRYFKIVISLVVLLYIGLVVFSLYGKVKDSRIKRDGKSPISSPTASPDTPTPRLTPPATPTSYQTVTLIPSGNTIKVLANGAKTIQEAVNLAQPGDVIELAPGTYYQDVVSRRDGLPAKPITIRGPKNAIVKGAGGSRVFEINHSYIILDGFTIDGLSGSPVEKSGYRDKLLYFIGKSSGQGPSHNRIINMDIKNAGGECVRLRYFARNNELANNRITSCGNHDYKFNDGGKNGEGIYIGTAPEQTDDKKNPTPEVDRSNDNWVHNNYFNTQGNECTDIKEGAEGNLVEYNVCTGQKDENSGGFDSRGNNNIFRFNEIFGNTGSGVRLGGDNDADGINNHVYQNVIRGNGQGAIKFQRTPQGKICGNEMSENGESDYTGSYGEDFDPEASC